MRTSDTVTGFVLIVAAGAMAYLTLAFPDFPGQKYGPALFPRLLAAAIVICGLLLIARGLASGHGQPLVSLSPWMREPWRLVSFALVPTMALACILFLDTVGFVPLSIAMLITLLLWFRVRPARAVGVAMLATLLLQFFFGKLMRVPLPLGWLLNLPPGWLRYIT